IVQEGDYQFALSALDSCSHNLAVSRNFTVYVTPPVVTVTGVSEGGTYSSPVTPVWSVEDLHLVSSQALLNGQPFESGTTISAPGTYILQVSGIDCAQN